jgi:Xaa-Pro aminopeptidase
VKLTKVVVLIVLVVTSAFAIERQPNSVYRARRHALADQLHGGVFILFAPTENDGPNDLFGFRQDDNFYYLTGLTDPGAALVIAAPAKDIELPDGGTERPYTEIMFLSARNPVQEKWTGPKLNADTADVKQQTGFDNIASEDSLPAQIRKLIPIGRGQGAIYGIEPDPGRPSHLQAALDWLARDNVIGAPRVQDASSVLDEMRQRKDPGEIELIRKATNASIDGHFAALKAIHPGVTEQQISATIQYGYRFHGCERSSYAPIVGSGFNSTTLHYSENKNTMKDGDLVVMDAAGEYSMYASDITRTAPVNGHFTPRQREIYNIVLGAQQAVMTAFQSGKSTLTGRGPDSLYTVAFNYINSHGKDQHGQALGKYFIHGLGHNVGLNVHDVGDTNKPLQPGSVFTVEPGIYIPEENLGVRIEDIVYVDQNGKLVDLTANLPHTPEDIEAAMAGSQSAKPNSKLRHGDPNAK